MLILGLCFSMTSDRARGFECRSRARAERAWSLCEREGITRARLEQRVHPLLVLISLVSALPTHRSSQHTLDPEYAAH